MRVCLPVAVGHAGCWLVVAVGVIPRFFRLTFRPRFAKSRNCLRIQTLKKHLGQKSTSFCREFRCASSWHSHLIRLPTFWKKSPVGTQIDKIWLNWQYTCSKNPGASFFWGRRSAAGSDHQTHKAGDHNLVSKQCQRKTLSKNSGAKPCQRNILSKSYILTVSDGIFWVSPIYLLYLMECFKLKGKGRVTGKGKFMGMWAYVAV